MSSLPDPEDSLELLPEEVRGLAEAIGKGEILLVDCREEEEWNFNQLPEARWYPLSRFAENHPAQDLPVIVYCHHGMRSLRAAGWLRAKGNLRVWSMAGGIDRWSREIDSGVPLY